MTKHELQSICKRHHNCYTCPAHRREMACLQTINGHFCVPADYPAKILHEEAPRLERRKK